jgi:hypothetical protein
LGVLDDRGAGYPADELTKIKFASLLLCYLFHCREAIMYLITDDEAAAVKTMRQAYDRLKELGWEDILRFKPEMIPFGSAPFLGIEVESYQPIECEYRGKSDEGMNIFISLDSDDDEPLPHERAVGLIMFRHHK